MIDLTYRMVAARHIVGDRIVLDWLVEAWRCSQPTVSRRLAAINAAPATAGLGRVERAIGRHGWWRVLLP